MIENESLTFIYLPHIGLVFILLISIADYIVLAKLAIGWWKDAFG